MQPAGRVFEDGWLKLQTKPERGNPKWAVRGNEAVFRTDQKREEEG
jgi:hypothetical protein